jgi:hypothetical protein
LNESLGSATVSLYQFFQLCYRTKQRVLPLKILKDKAKDLEAAAVPANTMVPPANGSLASQLVNPIHRRPGRGGDAEGAGSSGEGGDVGRNVQIDMPDTQANSSDDSDDDDAEDGDALLAPGAYGSDAGGKKKKKDLAKARAKARKDRDKKKKKKKGASDADEAKESVNAMLVRTTRTIFTVQHACLPPSVSSLAISRACSHLAYPPLTRLPSLSTHSLTLPPLTTGIYRHGSNR